MWLLCACAMKIMTLIAEILADKNNNEVSTRVFIPNAGGDCWKAVPDVHGPTGKTYKFKTIEECQDKCINTAECAGIDWVEIGKIEQHVCQLNPKLDHIPLAEGSKKSKHFDLDPACNKGQLPPVNVVLINLPKRLIRPM